MKKKPILICLYAYYPFENANTNVMLPIINALSEEYEVHILTENRDNTAPHEEITSEGIYIHRYPCMSKFQKQFHNLVRLDTKKQRTILKSILINILSPIAKKMDEHNLFLHPEYVMIRSLMEKNSFRFVMTTCANFDSHRNMLRYKLENDFNTPWISYFMDPFAFYIENCDIKGDLLQLEMRVYEKCDLVLVTEEIYEENHHNELCIYLDKTKPVKFGNFTLEEMPLINDIFIPDKINCVYVGSLLNERIRDPRMFYRLIDLVDDRFVFHIICNNVSADNKRLFNEIVREKEKVCWYHNLPLAECKGIMNTADILINLGNKTTNQTPSKVFDYIGTGKPIINLCSIEPDTSKKYLQNYPLVLNLIDSQCTDNDIVTEFTSFATRFRGVAASKDEINKKYAAYKSENVTQKTLHILKAAIEENI